MTVQVALLVIASITLLLALLGWAYQLGRSDARTSRNEQDIARLQQQRDEDEKDLKAELRGSFDKVYKKIDDLPCHNPGWRKDKC